jgi:hypothetical protein
MENPLAKIVRDEFAEHSQLIGKVYGRAPKARTLPAVSFASAALAALALNYTAKKGYDPLGNSLQSIDCLLKTRPTFENGGFHYPRPPHC